MNDNHRTDQEFENFLKNIGGIKISHKPHLEPITERKEKYSPELDSEYLKKIYETDYEYATDMFETFLGFHV